ncbi:hypothetical protein LCGC14_0658230 [marine sediment metagenome]|uniref:Uncharacterized protein n=1 Tax=marine sediment metagenome TaxID=412755 RepID=A0A0F9QZH2_9ZZZZ
MKVCGLDGSSCSALTCLYTMIQVYDPFSVRMITRRDEEAS